MTTISPVTSAEAVGLQYVTDESPGIRRIKKGKGFSYTDSDGQIIKNKDALARIKSLVIPPAYKDIWICSNPEGHLQATGIDDRGRKQYRYHPKFREIRDETKYARMTAFAVALPKIRERIKHDLAKKGLPREKILAAVVELLEKTRIRVGNQEYEKQNKSFGLTTLKNRHIDIKGDTIQFHFKGKSGKYHEISLQDKRLAQIVSRLQDLPGQELFQYLDSEGNVQNLTSADVNGYLKEISGQDFTAKDFRTWKGTVYTAAALQKLEPFSSKTEAKRNITTIVKDAAQHLGNTPAICRKCYIHPQILEHYVAGTLNDLSKLPRKAKATFTEDEAAVLHFLKAYSK